MQILVITKRQYMNKDLIDDHYGRFREIPLALARLGHQVKGLCLSYQAKNEGWINDGPVLWKSINAGALKAAGLARFIKTARRHATGSDVIWACSDSIFGIIGHLISSNTGVPFIFDLYDNFEYFLAAKLPVIQQLYRLAVKNCRIVTCISRPLAELVSTYGRTENVVILENAVRNDLFYPMLKSRCRSTLGLPENCKLIGTAGALEKNRGIQSLFEAFDLLKTSHPDLHLVLAGTRKIKVPQEERIHDLGVLPMEKVPLLLNALDVAVICNLYNKFGRYCYPQKAPEIMACDVPLVAANVGSMAELFKDRPEWLFTPGSSRDMANIIEHRLRNQNTGYSHIPSWEDLGKKLVQIMLNITDSHNI